MIGIKVAAIALTGLGSTIMGANFYRATLERSTLHASWQQSGPLFSPLESTEPRAGPDVTLPDAPTPDSVLTLKEVTIHSSSFVGNAEAHAAASPQVEPAKLPTECSYWRLPQGGPSERDVWTLCIPGSLSIPSP
jgi:hypothetical protein